MFICVFTICYFLINLNGEDQPVAWLSIMALSSKLGFVNPKNYDAHRPDYTDEAVQTVLDMLKIPQILDTTHLMKIVELGSGTGKFTCKLQQLLPKNIEFIATDPNEVFLSALEEKLPETTILKCSADNVPLDSSSIQGIMAAQCFHWFANKKALDEIHRALEDSGNFVILFNTNDFRINWVDQAIKAYQVYYTDEPNFYTYDWRRAIDNYPGFKLVETKILPGQKYQGDLDFIIGHFSSVSTVQKLKPEEQKTVLNEIRRIITTHPDIADINCIQLPMFTEIYHYKKIKIK